MSRKEEPTYATTAAVAGLAGELEQLRRRIEPLHTLPGRLEQLAALVDETAQRLDELLAQPRPELPPSWLMAPADTDTVRRVLDELQAWMQQVFLRYTDAAAALPECWLWHPDLVEELLWLEYAWWAAYQGPKASVALAGDWHDRQRPGVVRRIKHTAGTCSLENHTPARPSPEVPLAEAAEPMAAWWAEHRASPAPEPTDEQLAAVSRRGGMRR